MFFFLFLILFSTLCMKLTYNPILNVIETIILILSVIGFIFNLKYRFRRILKLSYYMNLPYKVETKRVDISYGGLYKSKIVGLNQIYGVGYTDEESLISLEKSKKNYFSKCLKFNVLIPKPTDLYSE